MSGGVERVYETPAGVKLCLLESLADGRARNFVLDIKGKYFHGFVVRQGSDVYGYVDSCPHMQLPLAQKLDDYLSPDSQYIACSWHSALFQIKDGLCVGGPCSGQSLRPWPVRLQDQYVVTG